MEKNPPKLHMEVMEMSPERFQRERLANQSIVSKACRHGLCDEEPATGTSTKTTTQSTGRDQGT